MNQEECVEPFKQMIGEALLLGMKLSDNAYQGLLLDEENDHLRVAIERLFQSTREFLAASSIKNVTAEQVFPLYEEMQLLLQGQE